MLKTCNTNNGLDPDLNPDPDRTSIRTRTSLPLEGETRGPGGFVRVVREPPKRAANPPARVTK
jgi:hypothetical protein